MNKLDIAEQIRHSIFYHDLYTISSFELPPVRYTWYMGLNMPLHQVRGVERNGFKPQSHQGPATLRTAPDHPACKKEKNGLRSGVIRDGPGLKSSRYSTKFETPPVQLRFHYSFTTVHHRSATV